MSGALAATLQSACCCGRDGGGGGGSPDDCGPSGPGAESDRATTAVAIALDISYVESFYENKIRSCASQSLQSGALGPRNCVVNVNGSCSDTLADGTPFIPYRCCQDPFQVDSSLYADFFRRNGVASNNIFYGTCYNQTGNSNHLANFLGGGTTCACQRLGSCVPCSSKSVVVNGGSAIAEQVTPNAREWRTYQSVASLLPEHRLGQWSWMPGQYTVRTVADLSPLAPGGRFVHTIRLFCPAPFDLTGQLGTVSGGQGQPLSIGVDPTGAYVDMTPASRFPFVNGRWGYPNVGPLYSVSDVRIRYVSSFFDIGAQVDRGPGWLAGVRVWHVYRDQHLVNRHRFNLVGVSRWDMEELVPPESGFALGSVTGYPSPAEWRLWKPCLSDSDTVMGTYEPVPPSIGVDPVERDVYLADPCVIGRERRIQAYLYSITVS